MRTLASRFLAVSGAAVLVSAAHDVASAQSVAGFSDGGWIAYAVSVAGRVSSVDGRSFRIDEVALALPGDGDELPANPFVANNVANYDQYQFAQGDLVTVNGSLRADGSILAIWFQEPRPNAGSAATQLPTAGGGIVMSDQDPNSRYQAGAGRFTSGVVASVDAETVDGAERPVSFVVDGVTYRIDPDQTGLHDSYFKAEQHAVGSDGSPVAFHRIAAGDAVLVDWTVEEEDGSRDATRVSIRQAGGDTMLSGTITGVWGDGYKHYNFEIDGVPVVADDYLFRSPWEAGASAAPWNPYAPGAVTHYLEGHPDGLNIAYQFQGVDVGMHVRVDGTLRDGRLFADRVILVIANEDSLRAKRAAKRAGRLRAKGMLKVDSAGVLRLSGLPVTLPRRASRAMAKRAVLAASRPVRIDARVVGGGLVATKIARR